MSVVLVPLFFGVLQLALIWHVRTTLTSAASAGARYGASYDRTLLDAQRRTSDVINDNFGADFPADVTSSQSSVAGQPGVEVDVVAQVPTLGLWGPTITVQVQGRAVQEVLP